MSKKIVVTALKTFLPLLGGAFGTYLLTDYPAVHAAICLSGV